ncbi:MAG: tandem-95 repeat protein [Deltaproteobacteria bacterium]|nr:tandem-95 repeat protein [Deltaproteobacteria bacterium]
MKKQFQSIIVTFIIVAGINGVGYAGILKVAFPEDPEWGSYTSIQEALSVAANGDEIWVKAGTYTATPINLYKTVGIYGGFEGTETGREERDPQNNVTIVDGRHRNRCFHITKNAILDGLTIQDGYKETDWTGHPGGAGILIENASPLIIDCIFDGNRADYYGGAIYNDNADPVITRCTFTNNRITDDYWGGAIYNDEGSDPVIRDCTFQGNLAKRGGAIFNSENSAIIVGCTFIDNTAISLNTIGGNAGGAIYNRGGSTAIRNCTFSQNSAKDGGGAIGGHALDGMDASLLIAACTFADNRAEQGSGGAIIISGFPSADITNCLFSGNASGGGFGGAIFLPGSSSARIRNCTFSGNTADDGDGVIAIYGDSFCFIRNCIMWDDQDPEIRVIIDNRYPDSNAHVAYSDIQAMALGSYNIAQDPLFEGPSDFHLSPGSPCIGAGTPNDAPATDIEGNLRSDPPAMGAYAAAPVLNQAPVIEPIGDKAVSENERLEFKIRSSDPEGQAFLLAIVNPPVGARFDPATGIFEWIPTYTQAGMFTVGFIATDGFKEAYREITITVSDVNRPPLLDEIGDQTVNENELLEFTLSGSDVDGNELAYSADYLPDGAAFNADNRTFNWRPDYTQSGDYNVVFTVSDGEVPVSEAIMITVIDVNRAPLLDEIGDYIVNENELLTFVITSDDPDNDTLTYAAEDLPGGAAFNTDNQTFSWSPGPARAGTYEVRFVVTDDGTPALEDNETVTIIVNATPEAMADSYSTAYETALAVSAAQGLLANDFDADNDTLTVILVAGPANGQLSLSDNGSFIYSPSAGFVGEDGFEYITTDGMDNSTAAAVRITCAPPIAGPSDGGTGGPSEPPNKKPVIDGVTVVQQADYSVRLTAAVHDRDPDGWIKLYSWRFSDNLSVSTPDDDITHTFDGPGTYSVTLTVKDNRGAETDDVFIVEVLENYTPPVPAEAPECLADGDCDDGEYCNGAEVCLEGVCVDGAVPCEDNELCMEGEETCWTENEFEAQSLKDTFRRPGAQSLWNKRCVWLVLSTTEAELFDPQQCRVICSGPGGEESGLALNPRRRIKVYGNYILVPLCIQKESQAGAWLVELETVAGRIKETISAAVTIE